MNESEKLPIAAHLYVTLRRKFNRVIDVEWMLRNEEYAREIIRLVRKPGMEELSHYGDRMEELIFGKPISPVAVLEIPQIVRQDAPIIEEPEEDMAKASRYIGSLR